MSGAIGGDKASWRRGRTDAVEVPRGAACRLEVRNVVTGREIGLLIPSAAVHRIPPRCRSDSAFCVYRNY